MELIQHSEEAHYFTFELDFAQDYRSGLEPVSKRTMLGAFQDKAILDAVGSAVASNMRERFDHANRSVIPRQKLSEVRLPVPAHLIFSELDAQVHTARGSAHLVCAEDNS